MKNYVALILIKLAEFSEKHPHFTIGDILYSALRQMPDCDIPKSSAININGKEFYEALHKAIKRADEEEKE